MKIVLYTTHMTSLPEGAELSEGETHGFYFLYLCKE